MRKISEKQMPLMPSKIDHPQAQELNAISCILDKNPTIYDLAMQDLSPNGQKTKKGANGMTAEQVVRAAIVFSENEDYTVVGRPLGLDTYATSQTFEVAFGEDIAQRMVKT